MYVTASQAAKLLKVSVRRVRCLLSQKRIEGAFKAGRQWLIPLSDGRPIVSEGKRGPKPRWAVKIEEGRKNRRPRHKNLTVIKVSRPTINKNVTQGMTAPVISVTQPSNPAIHCHQLELTGPAKIFYSLEPRPDKGGTRVWIETHFAVIPLFEQFTS